MTEKSDISIYVFFYRDGPVVAREKIYLPVMAGNALLSEPHSMTGDDTGENISSRNPYYSELTGIYWVWKNRRHQVTGVCHYRRFFTARGEPFLYKLKRLIYFPAGLYRKRSGLIYTGNRRLFAERIISEQEIRELLGHYDGILPQPRKLSHTVEEHYLRYHDAVSLEILKSVIASRQPEYVQALRDILQSKRLYANNMFILKHDLFQSFMTWWFDVLFELERCLDLNRYTGYQKRILGFMAERLLNTWFRKHQLNCAELPVIYFKRLKPD